MKYTQEEIKTCTIKANDLWNDQPLNIRKIMTKAKIGTEIRNLLILKQDVKNFAAKEYKRIDDKIGLLVKDFENDDEKMKSDAANIILSNSMSLPLSTFTDSNSILADKQEIKAHFVKSYQIKLKEITGNDVKIPWSGKEAKLLCQDLETHGKITLLKYINIFFSDRDRTIADFTRYKNMAGYSFGVFHGMIPKLALSKVKQSPVCSGCGYTIGHSPDCSVVKENRIKKKLEDDEINRSRDENKDFSFMAEFTKKINKIEKAFKGET